VSVTDVFQTLFQRFQFFHSAHVFAQCFGYGNGTVGILVLFQKCGEHTACSKAAGVECVNVFQLFVGGSAIAHVTTSCLVVSCVGSGTHFLVDVHGRNVNFYVVGASHAVGAVACGKFAELVMKSQAFHKTARH